MITLYFDPLILLMYLFCLCIIPLLECQLCGGQGVLHVFLLSISLEPIAMVRGRSVSGFFFLKRRFYLFKSQSDGIV